MSQSPTLKLHVNLSHSHNQRRVTLLQRLTASILQLKVFPKRNLITLEEANATYAPIPILITQKYTDIEVCKTSFAHTSFKAFLFLFGAYTNYQ